MYPRIFHALFHEPWLIDPIAHKALQSTLLSRLDSKDNLLDVQGDLRRPEHGKTVMTYYGPHTIKHYEMYGNGIAYIPVSGVLGKKLSMMESYCGGYDFLQLSHAVSEAVKDDEVKSIVLDIDSPGGTVVGTKEAAALIAQANDQKPVYAFTETKAASAAYWITSQCRHIFTTPSAVLGSIGVYLALPKQKDEIELIKAGKYKAMGAKPLTADERKILQKKVDAMHAEFKAVVKSTRAVDDSVLEGLTYSGEESIENGLADSLVLSFDEVVELLN